MMRIPSLLLCSLMLGCGSQLPEVTKEVTAPAGPLKVTATSGKFKPSVEKEILPGLNWTADLDAALAEADKSGRLVFLNFTADICTNCKINEKIVFPEENVKALLGKYYLVELNTFMVPEEFYVQAPDKEQRQKDGEANLELQKEKFETEQLPLYVIVKPNGQGGFQAVGVYQEGKINNVDAFIEFLWKAQSKSK